MTDFFKLSGAGNDFIALVEPPQAPESSEMQAWCRRALSLGADGVFLLSREPQDPDSAVRMVHFNADGGRIDLCLNGSRCAVQLAFHLGWAPEGGEVTLITDAGRLLGRRLSLSETQVSIPPTLRDRPAPCTLTLANGRRFEGWLVRVGVPHFVVPSPAALDVLDLPTLGPALRHHPELQPNGANIDFIAVDGQGEVALRTFERGVEAETLACGTGAIACFLAGYEAGFLESPARFETAGGFPLTVAGETGEACRLDLAGDARLIATGSLCAGAAIQPQPPVWNRQPPNP